MDYNGIQHLSVIYAIYHQTILSYLIVSKKKLNIQINKIIVCLKWMN